MQKHALCIFHALCKNRKITQLNSRTQLKTFSVFRTALNCHFSLFKMRLYRTLGNTSDLKKYYLKRNQYWFIRIEIKEIVGNGRGSFPYVNKKGISFIPTFAQKQTHHVEARNCNLFWFKSSLRLFPNRLSHCQSHDLFFDSMAS